MTLASLDGIVQGQPPKEVQREHQRHKLDWKSQRLKWSLSIPRVSSKEFHRFPQIAPPKTSQKDLFSSIGSLSATFGLMPKYDVT